MNRAEVESLQAVGVICQANDASPLGKVLGLVRDVTTKEKAIIDSDNLQLPSELTDTINQSIGYMNGFLTEWENKGVEIAKANNSMMQILQRTMGRAQTTGGESIQNMGSASKATDEIKGGVKLG